jgi:hypothetical protein
MKKIVLGLLIIIGFVVSADAQTITDTGTLRTVINSKIVPNGTRQISANDMNRILNGIMNTMQSFAMDSVYKSNDTLYFVRRSNGLFGGSSYTTFAVKLTEGSSLSAGNGINISSNIVSLGNLTQNTSILGSTYNYTYSGTGVYTINPHGAGSLELKQSATAGAAAAGGLALTSTGARLYSGGTTGAAGTDYINIMSGGGSNGINMLTTGKIYLKFDSYSTKATNSIPVLTDNTTGEIAWKTPTEIQTILGVTTYTAGGGLNLSTNQFRLGGNLIAGTTTVKGVSTDILNIDSVIFRATSKTATRWAYLYADAQNSTAKIEYYKSGVLASDIALVDAGVTINSTDDITFTGRPVKLTVLATAEGSITSVTDGMVYYSSALNKFRVRENGTWKDMVGSGGGSDGNNYPTALDFTSGTLTVSRNGLTDLTVSLDGRYHLASSIGNVTAGSSKITLGGTPTGAALSAFSIDVNEANLNRANMTGVVPISGGAGQITANAALNAFLPTQTGMNSRVLMTNGTNTSWDSVVTSFNGRKGAVVAANNDYTFSQIGSKPTTLVGYGITDPVVLTSGSYANPSWITSLAASKITGAFAINQGGTGLTTLGTANQLLRVNALGNALEYFTPTYITGNQTITLTGDATGSGTTSIAVTLATVATPGTYRSVTVNAKGLVTAGTNPTTLAGYGITDPIVLTSGSYANPSWITSLDFSKITNKPTTRSGYGITDAEAILTFQNGVTRLINVITNDLTTGKAGGQTLVGGTAANDTLKILGSNHASGGHIKIGTGVEASLISSDAVGLWSIGAPTTTTGLRLKVRGYGTNNTTSIVRFENGSNSPALVISDDLKGLVYAKWFYNTAPTLSILDNTDSLAIPNWGAVKTYVDNQFAQAGSVTSVFGRSGAVTAQTGDYTFAQIGSKPTTIAGYNITDGVSTATVYNNPSWIGTLSFGKLINLPTTLAGYGITDPVVLTTGSYANPAWITSLAWSKITGTPTTRAGYGITDAEAILTFTSGLTRNINTVTNNLITGIAGGQTVIGGTAASNNLSLQSTTNATRGTVNVLDQLNVTPTPTGVLAQFKASTGLALFVLDDATTSGISSTNVFSGNSFVNFTATTTTISAPSTIDLKIAGTTMFQIPTSGGMIAFTKIKYNSAPTIVTTGADDLVMPHVKWVLDQIKEGDVANVSYTASTAATLADVGKVVFLDGTSAAVTYTINPATFNKKAFTLICKNATNTVKVAASSGTINGQTEYQLMDYESVTIYSDGTNMYIVK